MKQLRLAASVLALGVGVAAAQDQTYGWSGAYVGIQGGYQSNQDDVADPVANYRTNVGFDGGMLGAHAGYDRQFGQFVLGAVGDLEWVGGSGISDGIGGVFASAAPSWQGSLRLKAGVAFDNLLVYATGGLAIANYEFDYTCCGQGFAIGDQFKKTLTGYTVVAARHMRSTNTGTSGASINSVTSVLPPMVL